MDKWSALRRQLRCGLEEWRWWMVYGWLMWVCWVVGFFVPCALAGSGHSCIEDWGKEEEGGEANVVVGLTLGYS